MMVLHGFSVLDQLVMVISGWNAMRTLAGTTHLVHITFVLNHILLGLLRSLEGQCNICEPSGESNSDMSRVW